ncbi:unnamed protein product [Closterium sp. NIES-54]
MGKDGAPRGVSESDRDRCRERSEAVLSRKKQREAPESSVKVCKASAGAVKDRNSRPKQLCPEGPLDLVTKLRASSVVEAGEAVVLNVRLPSCLTSTVTRANDIRTATTSSRRPTLRQPLTKLLGRRGLAPTLLPLPLASSRTSTLSSSPIATTPTAATTTTPTAASTAATKAPTPATTPTAATTPSASTTSTASPTTTPAALATTPIALATTPATLALVAAALCTC